MKQKKFKPDVAKTLGIRNKLYQHSADLQYHFGNSDWTMARHHARGVLLAAKRLHNYLSKTASRRRKCVVLYFPV